MVTKNATNNICKIDRIANRSITITLNAGSKNIIKIINTYSPHMVYSIGGEIADGEIIFWYYGTNK